MGISYSAVKTEKPEAWEIGKDYYGLTDLFPPCAGNLFEGVLAGLVQKITLPKIENLPHIVGSRHSLITNTVFVVSDFYKTGGELINRVKELKQQELDPATEQHLREFYTWAGNDPLQFISDFDYLEDRDAEDEYELCGPVNQYRHMDQWYGEAGRKVGYDSDEDQQG